VAAVEAGDLVAEPCRPQETIRERPAYNRTTREAYRAFLESADAWPPPENALICAWWPDLPRPKASEKRKRKDRLHVAMDDCLESLIKNGKPFDAITARILFDRLKTRDKTGAVFDHTEDMLLWRDTKGNKQRCIQWGQTLYLCLSFKGKFKSPYLWPTRSGRETPKDNARL
jgi:hypothetical protein